jgi:outer membrane protein assembly factor BamB
MKTKKLVLLLSIVTALLLSSCSGASALTASSWPGISVNGDVAYVANNTGVIEIDLANGNQNWVFPAEPDTKLTFFSAPILVDESTVIAGSYNNQLISINRNSGQAGPWTFDGATNRYIGNPLVAEDTIYVPNADHNLYAFKLNGDYNLTWTFETGASIWGQPGLGDGRVYVGSLDHNLYAINQETGNEVWSQDLEGAIVGTPIEEGNLVFVGSFASKMYALDKDSGRKVWQFETEDWIWGGAVLDNGILYFGDSAGNFYAVDALTGTKEFETKLDGAVLAQPVVNDGFIFIGTEAGIFYALKPDLTTEWQSTIIGKIYGPPVIAGDLILVGVTEGEDLVVALTLNGAQRWTFNLEN